MSSSSLKKLQYQPSATMSNFMFRTDGFKKIVKGITYKRTSATIIRPGQQSYTSMGKRTQMLHYEIGKQTQNKDDDYHITQKSLHLLKRTKTADMGNRLKKNNLQSRQKQFIQSQRIQNESFKSILQKLDIFYSNNS